MDRHFGLLPETAWKRADKYTPREAVRKEGEAA
jgi:hypothetical protein